MPNNNPHGHNQYTKREHLSQKGRGGGDKPADATATAATGGPGTPVAGLPPESSGGATPAAPSGVSRRGFASMDEQLQREIASKGGHSQGRENNPGNFANDREKAREAGRKGGEAHGSNR